MVLAHMVKAVYSKSSERTRSQAAPQHQHQHQQSGITGLFSTDARYSKSKEALHLKQGAGEMKNPTYKNYSDSVQCLLFSSSFSSVLLLPPLHSSAVRE